jgi:hypothetical protein
MPRVYKEGNFMVMSLRVKDRGVTRNVQLKRKVGTKTWKLDKKTVASRTV